MARAEMKRLALVGLGAFALALGGCNNAVSGGAIGAGAGALGGMAIGSLSGDMGKGAVIGAVAGGIGGAIIGDQNRRRDQRNRDY
ncbi:MAG: osmotically-inducible lipoprotein B [Phycisphaerales bacterium]|nr:osmotically-inducible lipoprotein B [Phycisphaerales bacterium]